MRATIVGIAVVARGPAGALRAARPRERGRSATICWRARPRPTQLDANRARTLKPLLEDEAIRKVGHDLKFDALVLARSRHHAARARVRLDARELSARRNAIRSRRSRKCALEHLGYRALTAKRTSAAKAPRPCRSQHLSPEAVLDFAGERADLARQLSGKLAPLLVSEQLESVYRELEMPLMPVLADIERAGVRVDGPALAAQSRHIEAGARVATRRASTSWPARSSTSTRRSSSDESCSRSCDCPSAKKTGKTRSFSTAAEVLEELALVHELPRLVLEWRGLHKLKSTYIDALPLMVHPETGRVHTSFNQAVAATGRLSSSDPNLQNIPIRTELGREIRRAFIAAPGSVLISADYSQIELRVLAHLAGEEALIEAFRTGEDIHDRTAAKLFGANSGLSRHELRSRSKMVNYAVLYGKTPFTLAKDINVTQEAAQEFIDAYFAGFPRVRAFIDRTLEEARQTGVVQTMFGRRRLVPNLTSRNCQMRSQAEREAVNMPIQGTAADILKRAMIDLHAALPKQRTQGADDPDRARRAAVRVCTRGGRSDVRASCASAWKAAASLDVPLTVDVGIAENWRDAKH